jgi:hypothetical protein
MAQGIFDLRFLIGERDWCQVQGLTSNTEHRTLNTECKETRANGQGGRKSGRRTFCCLASKGVTQRRMGGLFPSKHVISQPVFDPFSSYYSLPACALFVVVFDGTT